MEKKTLSVLVVEPQKKPYAKEITCGLKSLQHEVGGYIPASYTHLTLPTKLEV